MASIVCKFGGSSLASADRIRKIRRIIGSDPERRYIIVSAPGKRSAADQKITDLLIEASCAPSEDNQPIISRICERYSQICAELGIAFDPCDPIREAFSQRGADRDYVASRGEYICARIMAEYLGMPFVDAADLIRLRADGRIDIPASRCAIADALHPPTCAVIPGFYGIDPHGRIRTLPRGGSDVTGAMIANAIRARVYENWTDVDGICSADPAIANDARALTEIGKREMFAIASAGAGVLHPDAISILMTCDTDILLKNTFNPGGSGTRISNRANAAVPCIAGRAADECGQYEISIFHPADAISEYIYSEMNPIHIIHMRDRIKIIVSDVKYEDSIRILAKMI